MAPVDGRDGLVTATVGGQAILAYITDWNLSRDQSVRPYLTYADADDDMRKLVGVRDSSFDISFMIDGTKATVLSDQLVAFVLKHNGTVQYAGNAYMQNVRESSARVGDNGGTATLSVDGPCTPTPTS